MEKNRSRLLDDKEQGFTLIELLAVIVILAVIALIATPTILSIINRSRKGAAESSMLNYVETIEKELMLELVNDSSFTSGGTYTIQGKVLSKEGKEIKLELKGDLPKSDVTNTVEVDSIGQVVSANLKFGDYYVHYEFNENNATYCSNREAFKTCDGEKIDTSTQPEETEYKAYKTGKTSEVSVIYFNPVENSACTVEEYDTDLETYKTSSGKTTPTEQKTGCMKWYVIENSSEDKSTVDVLLDHSLFVSISRGNIDGVLNELMTVSQWNITPRLITAHEVANITGKLDFNSEDRSSWFYFDTNTSNNEGTYGGQYSWLYNYTYECTKYGCNYEDANGEFQYWTSTVYDEADNAHWSVSYDGSLKGQINGGIRPVITIDKSKLN